MKSIFDNLYPKEKKDASPRYGIWKDFDKIIQRHNLF